MVFNHQNTCLVLLGVITSDFTDDPDSVVGKFRQRILDRESKYKINPTIKSARNPKESLTAFNII
jgi:hypothetical protein